MNQEMLKGLFSNTRLGTTYAYNPSIINSYLDNLYDVFNQIKILRKKNIKLPLKGKVRHETFKRLV